MTIIRPKGNKKTFINPTLVVATCGIIILAAANVVAYDRIVSREHTISDQKKTLESTRIDNAELKQKWYQARSESTINALVKEYGFIKVTSFGYLPS